MLILDVLEEIITGKNSQKYHVFHDTAAISASRQCMFEWGACPHGEKQVWATGVTMGD